MPKPPKKPTPEEEASRTPLGQTNTTAEKISLGDITSALKLIDSYQFDEDVQEQLEKLAKMQEPEREAYLEELEKTDPELKWMIDFAILEINYDVANQAINAAYHRAHLLSIKPLESFLQRTTRNRALQESLSTEDAPTEAPTEGPDRDQIIAHLTENAPMTTAEIMEQINFIHEDYTLALNNSSFEDSTKKHLAKLAELADNKARSAYIAALDETDPVEATLLELALSEIYEDAADVVLNQLLHTDHSRKILRLRPKSKHNRKTSKITPLPKLPR